MESTLSEVPEITKKELVVPIIVGVILGIIAYVIKELVTENSDLRKRNSVLSESAREMFEASMRDKKPANENEPTPV